MTREEAYNTLMRMRAWRKWGRGEQNEEDRPPIVSQKEVDEALDVFIETLKIHIFPKDLDEAAENAMPKESAYFADEFTEDGMKSEPVYNVEQMKAMYKAGAEWAFGQGISFEYEVEDKSLDLGYGTLVGIDPILNLPDSFNVHDKVIIQVRKK